jgi:hypothetical protein
MNDMGYKFKERKKCYYTDSHECLDVIEYRNKFIKNYLNNLEIQCHRYIQIPLKFYDKLINNKKYKVTQKDTTIRTTMDTI